MGSSMDASNTTARPGQTQKPAQSQSPANQSQSPQSQNTDQTAQSQSANMGTNKTSTDNNIAAPRKECKYESVVSAGPQSQDLFLIRV